jgi:hypothetical protein
MLEIFRNYESSKIDLFSFFKENISKITKGGSSFLEHGNLNIRSFIPFYPPKNEQTNISFIGTEQLANLQNIRVWNAF